METCIHPSVHSNNCVCSSKLQLQPDDQVLVRNNKVGVVRYVGHLDSVGTPSVVYVGVELELPGKKWSETNLFTII